MKPVSTKHLQLLGVIFASITTLAASADPQHSPRTAAIIERLDRNGDGMVSKDEFEPPKRMKRRDKVQAADANGDGTTSREEWLSAVRREHERASKQFDEMDLNGDNVLNDSEMRMVMFQRADANSDGLLSADELNQFHGRRHNHEHRRDHKHRDNHKHGHSQEHGEDGSSSAG